MKENLNVIGLGLVIAVFGAAAALVFINGDRILYSILLSSGISPSIVVLVFVLLLFFVGIYFLIVAKKEEEEKSMYWIPAFVWSVSVGGVWIARGGDIKISNLEEAQANEVKIYYNEKDGYSFIGEVVGKNKEDYGKRRDFLLYVKTIEGKKHYYCASLNKRANIREKYLVEKYDSRYGQITYDGKTYIITYDFDWDNIYVSNDIGNDAGTKRVSQKSTGRADKETNSHREKETKVIVEHQRSLQPVNVWQNCSICLGSGNCQSCGGAGWIYSASAYDGRGDCYNCRDGKCPACGGSRGRYVIEYR